MAETWDKYYKAVDAIREPVRDFMSAMARSLGYIAEEDPHSDEWGFAFTFHVGDTKLYAELRLRDASSYGDAEEGEKGNIYLSVIKDGGLIVRGWAPHNYSDECWVSYDDTAELVRRVPSAEEGRELAEAIRAELLQQGP